MSSESNPTYVSSLRPAPRRAGRLPLFFVSVLLLVEFLDEIMDGVSGAAWPFIRDDLRLSYAEVGVLLSVPSLVATFVEPVLGILADVWRRRALVLAGGVAFALSVLSVGLSYSFGALLLASVLFYPASGAFVNFSQAALMDAAPARREQNMVRWTLAGTVGNLVGPLLVGACGGLRRGLARAVRGAGGVLAGRARARVEAAVPDAVGRAAARASARVFGRACARRSVRSGGARSGAGSSCWSAAI